ncbi:GDP-fucose protein O-fucosyltransferase 2 [Oopsacas minuta]|uniref:GDP-fucose protein O-fucosyltransferase 2 n=1 Tax=Oopsacas minuta TaxID=111878 RepID=A0AAV7JXG2_9METZ|nr:GDP-fucose protein O-fucosyltransferase 2 [Oopsacas minuta]
MKFLVILTTLFSLIQLHSTEIPLTTANSSSTRFLTYMVNPPEGFNLRRDVYVRISTLIHRLIENGQNWVLVLPPWPHLYHWKSGRQNGLSWLQFFDIQSMSKFIPVIDWIEYQKMNGPAKIDRVWKLETPDFTVEGYKFETEFTPMSCENENTDYTLFGSYHDPIAELGVYTIECYKVMGSTDVLETPLSLIPEGEFLLIEHFEMIMHYQFAGKLYWAARASMVYAEHLRSIGDEFMLEQFDFSSENSLTGDYLSVHLRRGDYVYARPDEIPSLDGAIQQIEDKLNSLNLSKVFLASDSSQKEYDYIQSKLGSRVVRYTPKRDVISVLGDGGISIIDQWIALHAMYFIGTAESTFTFRICEERQLKGIPVDSTYNCLCPDTKPDCIQLIKWNVVT